MAVNLSPVGGAAAQFFNNDGTILLGGKLNTYMAGTTTPATTYTTSAGSIANSNPIVLNSAGRVPGSGEIWLTDGITYKFVLTDANDVLIATYDNIYGINNIAFPISATNVNFLQAGTGAVVRTVQNKEQDIVSVKDFGAVGDGTTDDTAAIQLAYNYVASQGGGKIIWPHATYYVAGTIIFGTNTETDGCKSRINANGQLLFDTGYLSGGVLVSNNATAVGDYSTAVFNSSIGNFLIYDASDVFRLFKFLSGSRIHDIECQNTTGRLILAQECFYSNFERLIRYGTSNDGIADTGNFTSGSSVATVANATAVQLSNGMVFRTTVAFPVATTTITAVGAADSGGAGLTNVTLSQVSNITVSAGGINSGFVAIASANIVPLYEFTTANSNIVFNKCSAAARWLGWSLNEVNSSTFISPDITACTIGMQFTGSCTANTITAAYVENVKNYVYDCTAANAAASLNIGPSNYFNCAGVITAGLTGQVSGTLNLGATLPGYTPYGFSSAGSAFIDLNSPNAQMVVIGGPTDLADMNGVSPSGGVFQHGVWMPNNPITNTRVLDFYLKGTFTPVLEGTTSAGVGTYTTQLGVFTRIGNRVFFTINLAWTAHTGTGNMLVSGLPYTPALVYRVFSLTGINLSYTNGNQLVGQMGGLSFTKIEVVQIAASASPAGVAIDTSAQINVTGNYEI